ncbi:PHD finger protein 20-like protein 1 isoform X2 [Diachasma alloeum]|uniref:PHD finger protein 20-like protein 1 isoform X2 n=1 Tax=Diachasma alloeum TaxID=454923 RepID=UPI0007381798|nr:PHD finger protein 20-like protein 1 isoform X2 [Diachasma alloeum]
MFHCRYTHRPIMPVKSLNVSYPQEDLDVINSKMNVDETIQPDSMGYNDSCGEACNSSRPTSSADSLNHSESASSQDDNDVFAQLEETALLDRIEEKVKRIEVKETPPAEPPPVPKSPVLGEIKNQRSMENIRKPKVVTRGDLKFFPGAKLEAKDFNDQWYAARVVETDWVDREVLIHFDKWNSRFDEWIPMDSPRLRVLQVLLSEQAKLDWVIATPDPKPRGFSTGERILATWADGRKYPATVKAVLGNDRYDVLFDDGYARVVRSSKMTKIAGAVEKSSTQQRLPMEPETYIGSKQERRDKKRKHTVTELFNSRKRTKADKEGPLKKEEMPDAPEQESEILEASGVAPSYDSGPEMLKGFPSPKKAKNFSKKKRQPEYPKVVDTDQDLEDDPGPEWVNGEPQGIEAFTTDGSRRSVIVPDKRLPAGWQKHFVQRKTGNSAGKWDVLFVHKSSGKKFRSRSDLKTFFEGQGQMHYNTDMFDFCIHRRKKSGGGRNYSVKAESPVDTPKKIKTLLPKAKTSPTATVGSENLLLSPANSPYSPAPVNAPGVATPTDPSAVFVGGLRVEMEDGAFKCPIEGCAKTFRKENLLQMHIKHYHKEYSQYVGSTPNVADLAYARTIGESIQDVTPKKTADKRKSLPERSIHSFSSISPLTAPIQNTTISDGNTTREDSKLEMMSPMSNSSMDITDDGVQRTEIGAMSPGALFDMKIREEKTQVGIKTLLPVRPSATDPQRTDRSKSVDESNNFDKLKGQRKRHLSEYSSDTSTKSRKPKGIQEFTEEYGDLDDSALDAEGPAGLVYRYSRRKSDPKSDENSQSNGEGAMIEVNGELVKVEQLEREEIINCTCGITEEDGLMVQCELCLCWQHGHCSAIERERDVPEKYVCYICRNPWRGRSSMKYSHDQDWIKEGKLEILENRTRDLEAINKRTAMLKRSWDLVGALIHIQETLHSLRVKINVAQKKDHPKLYLWANNWEKSEIPDVNLDPVPIMKVLLPKTEAEDVFVDPKVKNEETNDDKAGRSDNEGKSIASDSELMKILEEDNSVIGNQGNDAKGCKKEEEKAEGHILLDALTRGEGKEELKTEEKPDVPFETVKQMQPVVPEPEAPIDPYECRLRLLEHIEHFQNHLDAKLMEVEAQVDALEAMEANNEAPSADIPIRDKETMQMLLRDLKTIQKLAAQC